MLNLEQKFIKIEPDDSVKRTYVVFSSIDIEPGKFMFWRVMQSVPGTKIFLNDSNNGWYVHGIPSLGRNPIEAANVLSCRIKETNPQDVVFMGPSMGGFGAMLYASLICEGLDTPIRCLTFGSEFQLYLRGSRSLVHTRTEHSQPYSDVRPFLDGSNLSVTNIFGDADITDNYQNHLSSSLSNVRSFSVLNAPHAVSTYIGQKFNLIDLIRGFGEHNAVTSLPLSPIANNAEFGKHLWKGHFHLLDGEADNALMELDTAVSTCPENSTARNKLGIALFEARRFSEAINQQHAALKIDPGNANAHYHMSLALRELGREDEATAALTACCAINPHHAGARFKLAADCFKSQKLWQAEEHLDYLLEVDPKHSRAKAMLRDVLSAAISNQAAKLARLVNP